MCIVGKIFDEARDCKIVLTLCPDLLSEGIFCAEEFFRHFPSDHDGIWILQSRLRITLDKPEVEHFEKRRFRENDLALGMVVLIR